MVLRRFEQFAQVVHDGPALVAQPLLLGNQVRLGNVWSWMWKRKEVRGPDGEAVQLRIVEGEPDAFVAPAG